MESGFGEEGKKIIYRSPQLFIHGPRVISGRGWGEGGSKRPGPQYYLGGTPRDLGISGGKKLVPQESHHYGVNPPRVISGDKNVVPQISHHYGVNPPE